MGLEQHEDEYMTNTPLKPTRYIIYEKYTGILNMVGEILHLQRKL